MEEKFVRVVTGKHGATWLSDVDPGFCGGSASGLLGISLDTGGGMPPLPGKAIDAWQLHERSRWPRGQYVDGDIPGHTRRVVTTPQFGHFDDRTEIAKCTAQRLLPCARSPVKRANVASAMTASHVARAVMIAG
jgi:hypothetical protein